MADKMVKKNKIKKYPSVPMSSWTKVWYSIVCVIQIPGTICSIFSIFLLKTLNDISAQNWIFTICVHKVV